MIPIHFSLRWFIAAGLIAGPPLAQAFIGLLPPGEVPILMGAGMLVGGYNALAWWMHRRGRRGQHTLTDEHLAHAATLLDYIILTFIVWRMGGTRSPLMGFYLMHVVLGAILLERKGAITNALIAFLLLAAMVVAESSGLLGIRPVPWMTGRLPLEAPSWLEAVVVLLIYGLLLTLVSYLVIGISESLRQQRWSLESANQQLDRLSRLRRDFMRLAFHNLRSPVGVVAMHLRNMVDGRGGELHPPVREWSERSLERISVMTQFLSDMQMLGMLEAGELEGKQVEVDLGALLRETVAEYQEQAHAHEHDLRLELPQEGALVVRGIARLLQEAIANYLTNAIKYTPRGGQISLVGRIEADHAVVDVHDTGIGVPADQRGELFQEGVRLAEEVDGERREGTGLGLWLVKRIAEWHGGAVTMRERPGGGSVFSFTLPLSSREH